MYLFFSGESSEKQGKKYVTNIFYINIHMYKKKSTILKLKIQYIIKCKKFIYYKKI